MKLLVFFSTFLFANFQVNGGITKPRGNNIKHRNIGEPKICVTQGCNDTASYILSNMDNKIDPCTDFYEFACGNFVKNKVIPDDKISVGMFDDIHQKLKYQLKTIIEEESSSNELKAFQIPKMFYKSCMNETRINERGFEPLHKIFTKLGGWPVLLGDQWDESKFDWIKSVYKLRELGLSTNHLFDLFVSVDSKNNTRHVIKVGEGSLGLVRIYLLKGKEDKNVKAYYNYMVDVAKIMGADNATAHKDLEESLEFEMKLANISLPPEKYRNASNLYNLMKIKDLSQKFPSIPWLEYINMILKSSQNVTADEPVIVTVPSFITGLEKLLEKTPKRVIANYIMWKIVYENNFYLHDKIRERQLIFHTALSGAAKKVSRWEECVSVSIAMSSLYVREYFDEEAKVNAIQMVSLIKEEFKNILRKVEWMDEETKKAAVEKLNSMQSHIAYPDELLDDTKLEEYYKKLEINSEYYFESMLNTSLFFTDYAFSKLSQPFNKSDWRNHGYAAIVNAFYNQLENSITFPAGILQGVFFNHDRPRYINYGAIGYVIGHEITHGFDDRGSQYDKNGELINWWKPGTKEKYINSTMCIVNQYGNYNETRVGSKLNGVVTQGENIADNAGMKIAYLAYSKWASQNEPEPRLRGLEKFTPRQMFWISAANVWCEKIRLDSLKLQIDLDPHSPSKYRILGPMSNIPQFSKDFHCKSGSKMNPKNKCTVW